MLYLVGPASDSTTRHFASAARSHGSEINWIDLDALADWSWRIDLGGDAEWYGDSRLSVLPSGAPTYARLIAPGAGVIDSDSTRSQGLLMALASWLELSAGVVVNRPGHVLDNGSKALHEAYLVEAGFTVPPSLTSSDPICLRAFAKAHDVVVVKAISGIRADCRRIDAGDLGDFDPLQGPIHLQAIIGGLDIRVHVVGSETIAVAVRSADIDYRIAADAEYFPFDLPEPIASQTVEATEAMGLVFAGWDFKLDESGVFHALEANPMPGYHFYDSVVDGRITRALLEYLGSHR